MNDTFIKKIPFFQQRIAAATVLVGAGSLFLIFFVLIPMQNKLSALKSECHDLQNQIVHIERSITTGGEDIQEGVKTMEARMAYLSARFPAREEEGLRLISDLARQQNIEVSSVKVAPKSVWTDAKSQKIVINGKVCQKVEVSLKLRGRFQDLVSYIDALKGKFPLYMTFEGLDVSKEGMDPRLLNFNLNVGLYLLS